MKKIALLLFPILLASCGQGNQTATAVLEPMNVMSFNIRYDNPEDSQCHPFL